LYLATVTSFSVGLLAGVAVAALAGLWLHSRTGAEHVAEIERHRSAIADMRQERAGDREVNRRLRHELAINTPENLREERDHALFELDKLSSELLETTLELEDRDRSLRAARQAIHEIRLRLERDRFEAGNAAAAAAATEAGQALDEAAPAEAEDDWALTDDLADDLTDDLAGDLIDHRLLDSEDRETTSS
jgi:hypothetical protein